MLKLIPISSKVQGQVEKFGLSKKFQKAVFLLQANFRHPSLNTERLDPKHRNIYSFRIDKKYRGIFLYREVNQIEIILVTNHYS